MRTGYVLTCFPVQDFKSHPMYHYWTLEAGEDGDQKKCAFVRYLKTDIRLGLPNEIRGFKIENPHTFNATFKNGCISIPMAHVFAFNEDKCDALPEAPIFFEQVPTSLGETTCAKNPDQGEPGTPQKKKRGSAEDPPKTPLKKSKVEPRTPQSRRSAKDAPSPPSGTSHKSAKSKSSRPSRAE